MSNWVLDFPGGLDAPWILDDAGYLMPSKEPEALLDAPRYWMLPQVLDAPPHP